MSICCAGLDQITEYNIEQIFRSMTFDGKTMKKLTCAEQLRFYIAKMLLLAALAEKTPSGKSYKFETTRGFENTLRDQLAIPKFDEMTLKDVDESFEGLKGKLNPGDIETDDDIKRIFDLCDPFQKFLLAIFVAVSNDRFDWIDTIYNFPTDQEIVVSYNTGDTGESEKGSVSIKTIAKRNAENSAENSAGGNTGTDRSESGKNAICFVCFYAICSHLRRKRHHVALNKFIMQYNSLFRSFDSYEHIRLESLERENIDINAVRAAERLVKETMKDQAGVIMLYGRIIADFCEDNPGWDDSPEGRSLVNDAVRRISRDDPYLTGYPKTHMIRARLLAVRHEYSEALKCSREAISLQRLHEKDSDYVERLSDFYDQRMTIEVAEQMHKIEEVNRKMEGQEMKNIEILSIFTAVIALIIGMLSAAFSSNIDGWEIIMIILVLFGAVIVTFTLFYYLNHVNLLREDSDAGIRSLRAFRICFAAGVLLIAAAVLMYLLL